MAKKLLDYQVTDSWRRSQSITACRACFRLERREYHGFLQAIHARTQDKAGKVIPVVITVYAAKSFDS